MTAGVYRAPMGSEHIDDDWMRIEELAARTGMTVRNIRAHRSRGLLPAPRMIGRTGWYGPQHRRRLAQIRRMQDEGLNLAAISRVLIDGRLTDATAGVFREAEGEIVEPGALADRFGVELDTELVRLASAAGVVDDDGTHLRIASARLLAVAEHLDALGVPIIAQLEAAVELRAAARRVAAAFMDLADEHLIERVMIDSRGDLEAIENTVADLHLQAREALQAVFDREMSEAIARHLGALTGAGEPPEPEETDQPRRTESP